MKGDLSVTALYTSATWSWGGLPDADLLDHPDARRVFRAVNAVLGVSQRMVGLKAPLRLALLHRHTLIDALLRASGFRHVLELACGLSRRGVTFTDDPTCEYIEADRPSVIERKRALLARTEKGRRALARANFRLVAVDVETTPLTTLCPPTGQPLFVIAEGLFMYLQPDAQRALARAVAARLADGGGTFVFDLVPPRELPPPGLVGRALGWVMKRFTGGRGFESDDRTREQMLADLQACGFDSVEAIEPRQVAATWNLPYPEAPTQQLVFVARVQTPRGRS